jgi:hypothetical protein
MDITITKYIKTSPYTLIGDDLWQRLLRVRKALRLLRTSR